MRDLREDAAYFVCRVDVLSLSHYKSGPIVVVLDGGDPNEDLIPTPADRVAHIGQRE